MSYKVFHQARHTRRINELLEEVRGDGAGRFAEAQQKRLVDGNKADRLRGVDRRGRPLAELKRPRTGYYRGETGPVLAPYYENSDCIKGYFARITRKAAGWTLTAGIASAKAAIFVYHALGKGRYGPVAVRDILGTSPKVMADLRRGFHEWRQGMFRKRGYRG